MINHNQELLNKKISTHQREIRRRTKYILLFIFVLMIILILFGAKFFYDSSINIFSIREKKMNEEFDLPLSDENSKSIVPNNFNGFSHLPDDFDNNWGGFSLGSAYILNNEIRDVPLFELSYFNNTYYGEIVNSPDVYEVEVISEKELQSYNFYKNKEVWDKAVFSAKKIFTLI